MGPLRVHVASPGPLLCAKARPDCEAIVLGWRFPISLCMPLKGDLLWSHDKIFLYHQLFSRKRLAFFYSVKLHLHEKYTWCLHLQI